MKKGIVFIFIVLLFCPLYCWTQSTESCCSYLEKNGKAPSEYLISKFKDYDYIFLGENHRIKQDVNFVITLIPELYKNGIRNIAYEFYEASQQEILDSLLTAKSWDDEFFYDILSRDAYVMWGYSEYLNLIRKVWEFNQTLDVGEPKFRIVLMGMSIDICKNESERFGGIDPEKGMASIIEKEIIAKGEKALIYCGVHHAFTRYHQPVYDFEKNQLNGYMYGRIGNVIYKKYPEQTFMIVLHSSWISNKGFDKPAVKPVKGSVDSVMNMLNDRPIGFDVKNSVMGKLTADDTYYAFGYEDFKLEDFCDGYIFLTPFEQMKNVDVEENFYMGSRIEELKRILKCVGFSDEKINSLTQQDIIELIGSDGNVEKRVEHLKNNKK